MQMDMNRTLPSAMKHDFSNVPTISLPRSTFQRNHTHKTAFNADYLIPIYVEEILPGDTVNLDLTFMARLMSPLKTPIMDNLYMDIFFVAVPLRILQTNFPKIFGTETDPGDANTTQTPVVAPAAGGFTALSIWDYFGLPLGIENINIVNYAGRAYNMTWNQLFRDQNLQDSVVVDLDDGPDTVTDYVLLKRGKRHDYFTSALPWPQKSDSTVMLPLGGNIPIIVDSTDTTAGIIRNSATHAVVGGAGLQSEAVTGRFETTAGTDLIYDPVTSLVADGANAQSATLNDLREAIVKQQAYELDARSGTRMNEWLTAQFGVQIPDSTMQRPEYLGGGSYPIQIAPVPQTSESATTKQGTLTAVGAVSDRCGFTKSFVEYTIILGLANLRADITYQNNAIHRMWSRRDRWDFYQPITANLGEQEILNEEIFAVDGSTDTDADGITDNKEVWAYQERWAEYRYAKSMITATLRSDHAQTLDTWHVAEDFSALPPYNAAFIVSNAETPLQRVSAVSSQPKILFDGFFRNTHARVMPTYSVPGIERL